MAGIRELLLNLNTIDPRFQLTIYELKLRQWSMVQSSSHQICIFRKLADSFAQSSKAMRAIRCRMQLWRDRLAEAKKRQSLRDSILDYA